jgi:hypothetical protein
MFCSINLSIIYMWMNLICIQNKYNKFKIIDKKR